MRDLRRKKSQSIDKLHTNKHVNTIETQNTLKKNTNQELCLIITETASIIMAVSYEDSQFEKLLQIIDEKVFTPKEAAQALSIKKSSAYWLLHTLVRDQRLSRIARGYYTVAPDPIELKPANCLNIEARRN